MADSRLITVAIHTCERAVELKSQLESEGIPVVLQNVNLEHPVVSSGMRVRIPETDLPLALRIIENTEIFRSKDKERQQTDHSFLVPVDFTDYSLQAACAAFRIAAAHKGEIVLLNSYIDPYLGSNMQLTDALTFDISAEAEARRQIEQSAHTQMANFTQRIRELIKDGTIPPVKFSTTVVEGVAEDAIDEYSKINPPYMIIMGTRSTERKASEMIGSVAAEVINRCRCTVLTVPETYNIRKETSPRRIMFLCSLDQGDILALDTTSRIFNRTDSEVILTQVNGRRRPFERPAGGDMDRLVSYCSKNYPRFKFSNETVSLDRDLENLRKLMYAKQIDMIVVSYKKRRSLLGRLLNPSLAQQIIMGADLPLLVIRV